jgi:hypothetical protein
MQFAFLIAIGRPSNYYYRGTLLEQFISELASEIPLSLLWNSARDGGNQVQRLMRTKAHPKNGCEDAIAGHARKTEHFAM